MNHKLNYTLFFLFLIVLFACKHSHPEPSQTLKDAFTIQKSGLVELNNIENLINDLPAIEKEKFNSKKSLWQTNMIEIEGMQHDHSQCDGDHSKKRFAISDEDMLSAQSEWRDSILALKKDILKVTR